MEFKTITSRVDVPFYNSVLTLEDYKLAPEVENLFSALLLSDLESESENKNVLILFTSKGKSNYLAHYFRLKQQLKSDGYNVYEALSDETVIETILTEAKTELSLTSGNSSSIEEAFDQLIENCIQKNASDLYVLFTPGLSYFQMKINRRLSKRFEIPPNHAIALMRTGYNLADEDSKADGGFDQRIYQSVSISRKIGNRLVKLRYQTMVVWPQGINMIIRILTDNMNSVAKSESVDLVDLGFLPLHVRQIKKAVSIPSGLIAVAGPTGSGKTTTLKHVISMVDKMRHGMAMIRTIEDPPEYRIPEALQTPVSRNGRSTNPFADAIRASMRSAFDVMMAGEIRDEESAELLQQIVESGHQSLTTTHANSALSIINRFEGMKMKRDVLLSPGFMSAMMCQRLVPTVCNHCKIPFDINNQSHKDLIDEFSDEFDNFDGIYITNHHGCDHCSSGITGMTVCAEVVIPDEKLLDLLMQRKDFEARDYWLGKGNITYTVHGMIKVLMGVVSLSDFVFIFGYPDKATIDSAKSYISKNNM